MVHTKLEGLIAAKFPQLTKQILRKRKQVEEPVTVPKSTFQFPVGFGLPLGLNLAPTITIPEHTPGETPKPTPGLNWDPFGFLGFLMPDEPEDTQALTTITPIGSGTQYGENVTPTQIEYHKQNIEPAFTAKVPTINIPEIKFPDIFGGLKEAGKWILIGGAALVGLLIVTRKK
jgi:hypothetical protein